MKPKHRACQFIQIIVKYASLKFAFFKYAVPLVLLLLSFSTQAAGLRIVNPAADSKVKNAVVVTVKLPVSTNATAAKVNMIIDRQFFKSQPYIKGKVYYKFTIPTNRYTNGAHWVNVRSVVNGKIVAADTKRLLFANQVLAVHTPTANRTLSGIINVTGITRARASKINIKFGDINDNSVVFSHALPSSHVKAKPFAVQVDTRKIGINGPINMHVRAIRDGRNLRTVTRQVNLQNTLSITTAIPVPSSRAYFGIYTLNNLNQTAATAKQSATDAFEALVYENGNARVSMDRVFFQWDNLLKASGELNPYIRITADEGRIPVISVATIRKTKINGNDVNAPLSCSKPNLSTWACIAAGELDADIDAFVREIKAESEKPGASFKMAFTMHHEPLNEIRCNERLAKNPAHVCKPLVKSIDLGSAAEYIAAWRHMRTKFRAAKNVDFMWTLQGRAYDREKIGTDVNDNSFLNDPLDAYPGAAYVDWVAADIYNTATCSNNNLGTGCSWTSFAELTQPFLDWAAKHAAGKPLALGELGVPEDPRAIDINMRYRWLINARNYIKNHKQIKAVLYWNRWEVMDGGNIRDWRLDANGEDWRTRHSNIVTPQKYQQNPGFLATALAATKKGAQQMIRDSHFIRAGESFKQSSVNR